MLSTKHVAAIFVPALILVGIIFGIRFFQYNFLFADIAPAEETPALDLIPILSDDPILGTPSAPVTVVAFEDFACEGCKAQHSLFQELERKHSGAVKVIWKGLPVATFPYSSEPAHEYAYCANKQNAFKAFADLAFVNHSNLSKATLDTITKEIELDEEALRTCLASAEPLAFIDTTRNLARLLHVQQVPTFFVDNAQIITPSSVEAWEVVLGL